MKWMLFKQESTGDHYMWNGVKAVIVHRGNPNTPISSDLTDLTNKEVDTLTLTSFAQRKRTMLLRGSRYTIENKGEFKPA